MKFKLAAVASIVLGAYGVNAQAGTCTTGAWDQVTEQGNVTVTAEARAGYEGDCILAVNKPAAEPIGNGGFVRYDFASGEPRVRGRFIVDPTNMAFNVGAGSTGGERRGRIMDVRKPDAQPSPRLLFSMLVREEDGNPGNFQINMKWIGAQIGATPNDRARGRCTSPWVDIPTGPSTIEFDYQFESTAGASDGSCTFYVDGVQVDQETGLLNSTFDTGSMRLGLIRGFQDSYAGEVVMDAVELRRSTSPGCVSGVGACP